MSYRKGNKNASVFVHWSKVGCKLEKNINICFGGSEESSHCDGYFEHSHLMLLSVSPDICFGC